MLQNVSSQGRRSSWLEGQRMTSPTQAATDGMGAALGVATAAGVSAHLARFLAEPASGSAAGPSAALCAVLRLFPCQRGHELGRRLAAVQEGAYVRPGAAQRLERGDPLQRLTARDVEDD